MLKGFKGEVIFTVESVKRHSPCATYSHHSFKSNLGKQDYFQEDLNFDISLMASQYLSCKISSEGTFKSLGLRGVVMTVVPRESLDLGYRNWTLN